MNPASNQKIEAMSQKRTFIDLCAGCGGLSLGLMASGWRGLFAIEKNDLAFETLKHNLLMRNTLCFNWPEWLPKKPISLEKLLASHDNDLQRLRGSVDLLAGGPPCQGFSTVGRRHAHDPRNQVFKHYIRLVNLIEPTAVLIENVRGIMYRFRPNGPSVNSREKAPVYADLIKSSLETSGYHVWHRVIHAKDYGVPQTRPRFILIGIRRDGHSTPPNYEPFEILTQLRHEFLRDKQLDPNAVTVGDAISDLQSTPDRLEQCVDSPGFLQGSYGKQESAYQRLMHGSMNGALADSHRFTRHRADTIEKFRWFLSNCPKGKKLDSDSRGKYDTKKHTLYILKSDLPSPTVTTLPDDILHYREPRILTVREMARLQSFPDWFQFKGKYTTGGKERVLECPRYTQVGNAVPPLLAEALGRALLAVIGRVGDAK